MSDQAPTQRGSAPNMIEPSCYPALEELRHHCSRGGLMLIDRVYAEAQALHKRAADAEAELSLFVDCGTPASTFVPKKPAPAGEELL